MFATPAQAGVDRSDAHLPSHSRQTRPPVSDATGPAISCVRRGAGYWELLMCLMASFAALSISCSSLLSFNCPFEEPILRKFWRREDQADGNEFAAVIK